MHITVTCAVHSWVTVMCAVMLITLEPSSFVEENNPKLIPSIVFSSLKAHQKCVGGRGSTSDPIGGA